MIKTIVVLLMLPLLSLSARGDQDESDKYSHPEVQELSEERGLVIVRIQEDSPAEKAGLSRGDILLEIDSEEVNTIHDVHKILEKHNAGDTITLLIEHGDERKSVEFRLEERLYRPPKGITFAPEYSIRIEHMDRRGKSVWVLPKGRWRGPESIHLFFESRGALIAEVMKDSPAEEADLKKGDVIVSVDGEKLTPEKDLSGVITAHKPGDEVILSVFRRNEGDEEEILVTLGEGEDKSAYLGVRYISAPNVFIKRFPWPEKSDMNFQIYLPEPRAHSL